MADNTLMSPFNPQYSPQEEVRQDPVGLADQWRSFLADPASRASLMSFGAQLSQPVAPGNNWAGHIGQATGAAGEAATKAFSLEQGDIEKESKQVLREAQANAATSRAETAETRASTYQQRVDSQNQLSDQKAQTEENRRKFLEAQSELLYGRADKLKDDILAQQMRAEADMMKAEAAKSRAASQQQLYGARAADIPLAAEDRTNRNVIRQQDADTRSGTRLDRATAGQQAEERRGRQGDANLDAKDKQTYTQYERGILPGQPKLPYAEWQKQFGSGRGAKPTGVPPPAPGGSPSPQQPQPPLQNAGGVEPPVSGAHQRSDGRWYVDTPDGRLLRID